MKMKTNLTSPKTSIFVSFSYCFIRNRVIFSHTHFIIDTDTQIFLNTYCSCGKQIRYVRHKRYLTPICSLLSRLLPAGICRLWISRCGPVWTREGLPAEETPMLKSAKTLRKSNLIIRGVMNAYL